jgi:hypothetical protein
MIIMPEYIPYGLEARVVLKMMLITYKLNNNLLTMLKCIKTSLYSTNLIALLQSLKKINSQNA